MMKNGDKRRKEGKKENGKGKDRRENLRELHESKTKSEEEMKNINRCFVPAVVWMIIF